MKLELYTGKKTYMFPNGAVATPEVVLQKYPAIQIFAHVIETDNMGQVFFGLMNLASARDRYGIAEELTDEEAVDAIEAAMEAERNAEPEPSAEERVAAALEYQNLLSL